MPRTWAKTDFYANYGLVKTAADGISADEGSTDIRNSQSDADKYNGSPVGASPASNAGLVKTPPNPVDITENAPAASVNTVGETVTTPTTAPPAAPAAPVAPSNSAPPKVEVPPEVEVKKTEPLKKGGTPPGGPSWLDNNGEWVSQVGGGLLTYWIAKQVLGGTVAPAALALYLGLALKKNKFNIFGGEPGLDPADAPAAAASKIKKIDKQMEPGRGKNDSTFEAQKERERNALRGAVNTTGATQDNNIKAATETHMNVYNDVANRASSPNSADRNVKAMFDSPEFKSLEIFDPKMAAWYKMVAKNTDMTETGADGALRYKQLYKPDLDQRYARSALVGDAPRSVTGVDGVLPRVAGGFQLLNEWIDPSAWGYESGRKGEYSGLSLGKYPRTQDNISVNK